MRKYPTRQNLDDLDIDLSLPEEMDDVSIAKLYQKWSLDPISWCKYFFPHYFKKPTPEFHQDIVRNWLYLPHKIQAYEAPRGFAKTTLAEFLIFHAAMFQNLLFGIFVSKTEESGASRLTDIRHECMYNKTFKLFFGDMVSEKWGEKELILDNKKAGVHCKLMARGLGQQFLGLKYLYQRPQKVVIDDPEDMKIAENPANVDKDERWLTKEVFPALSDDGKTLILTTPVTADCLIERLSRRRDVFFKRYPALTDQGVPLWKEHKDAKALVELQQNLADAGQLYIYFSEYLCNPLSPDRHPFTEDMFKYYIPKDIDLYQQRFHVFFMVDLAIGEKKQNAFSAIVVVAVDETDTWYILDTFQTRSDWADFAQDLYRFRDMYNPLAIGVEEAATQRGFWDVLRLTAEKYGHKPIYPIALRPDKDKDIRARRLLPRFKMGKIRFLRNQVELKKQLILHPDYKYQDLKDCLAYGEVFCYPPGAQAPKEQKMENWRLGRTDSDQEMDEDYLRLKQNKEDFLDDWDGEELD
jgi:hypothetical protein